MAEQKRAVKVLHVVGARPNFMKIAPVMRELATHAGEVEQCLVHTGQHYDRTMSDVFFEDLGLPEPDYSLGVGSRTASLQIAEIMKRFEPILLARAPDWVVVVGDVNSTLACALVAAKSGIRVAHVEAGLRSHDRSMPEEINRVLTDQLASLLLTPSRDANANLLSEGLDAGRIAFVGNVMIDSLEACLPRARERLLRIRGDLGLAGSYVLATFHRPSNVDDPARLNEIVAALNQLAGKMDVLFPVHPRTRQRLVDAAAPVAAGVKLVGPQPYVDFLALQAGAALVLTDSGGVQEETTCLGVPCLTLRPNTERPVTIEQGTNRLVPPGQDIATAALGALDRGGRLGARRPELWDGQSARRIADAIVLGKSRIEGEGK